MHLTFIFPVLQTFLLFSKCILALINEGNYFHEESLTPYKKQHGSKFTHREIRDCHKNKYDSVPHVLHVAHSSINISEPFVQVKRFVKEIKGLVYPRTVRGHYVVLSNPLETLSVLEPDQKGGCALNIRQTVSKTATKDECLIAMNAGYFDTKQGKCLGNVISDGRRAHNSNGIQNAHFGLTNDNKIFMGYLSEEFYLDSNLKQLVGGVIWLLRNGTGFVNASKTVECEDTEETGPMESFVNILSARTAVGHDIDGKVILVQIEGKSNIDGVNLYEMETILKELGLVNAINLDGGGSATLVINGTTANYPYDACTNEPFSCDRKVSTVLCIHSPRCDPVDCNNHGSCSKGKCICRKNWLPPKCNKLFCGLTNCSNNGICLEDGCVCHPGYFGAECNQSCSEGWYGSMCTKQCKCFNSAGCDSVTGSCICKSGFSGDNCQKSCPIGFFGINCQFKCQCNSSCCDPTTGACEIPHNNSIYNYAQCIAQNIVQSHHFVKENTNEKWKWYVTMVILGVITAVCIASCLLISCLSCSCYFQNEQILCFKKTKKSVKKPLLQMPSGYISDSSLSENEIVPMKNFQKS